MVRDSLAYIDRRTAIKATGGTIVAGVTAGCLSEGSDGEEGSDDDDTSDFPQRDIQIIIPFGPGGGYDEYTRTISPYLEEYLPNDVDVVNENVEGASGEVATQQVYEAEPDGYTNMIVNEDLVMEQILGDTEYDLSEMTYYANLAVDRMGIGVGLNSGIESWDEFVDGVQSGDVRFALSGITNALAPAVIGELSGLWSADQVMNNGVIYESRSEAIQGILSGDAEAVTGSYYSILPFEQSDDIEILLEVSNDDEPPEPTPNADTLATAGVDNAPDIEDMTIDGRTFGGPPGIPEDRVEILRDAFEAAAHDDDFLSDMEEIDRPVEYMSGEEAQTSIENRFDRWEENMELLEAIYGD